MASAAEVGRISAMRPSTARFASAQDEEISMMPSKTYLILSRAPAKPRRVSKDAWCSCSGDALHHAAAAG
jgi:hypothetical protein